MMLDYISIKKELIQNVKIPPGDIYEFEQAEDKNLFENYFQFCQRNLLENSEEYKIHPAKIYYTTDYSINACAFQKNSYFLIGVNMGSLPRLRAYFEIENIFENELSIVNKPFQDSFGINATSELMFQVSTLFLFYHEQAHLIQISKTLKTKTANKIKKENIFTKHLKEFDADLFSTNKLCQHLLDFCKKRNQSSDDLCQVLALGGSALFLHFILFHKKSASIYFEEHCHPHPTIRLIYCIDNLLSCLKQYLPDENIPSGAILKRVFTISTLFLKRQEDDSFSSFVEEFYREDKKIESYIKKLHLHSANHSELVMNST